MASVMSTADHPAPSARPPGRRSGRRSRPRSPTVEDHRCPSPGPRRRLGVPPARAEVRSPFGEAPPGPRPCSRTRQRQPSAFSVSAAERAAGRRALGPRVSPLTSCFKSMISHQSAPFSNTKTWGEANYTRQPKNTVRDPPQQVTDQGDPLPSRRKTSRSPGRSRPSRAGRGAAPREGRASRSVDPEPFLPARHQTVLRGDRPLRWSGTGRLGSPRASWRWQTQTSHRPSAGQEAQSDRRRRNAFRSRLVVGRGRGLLSRQGSRPGWEGVNPPARI